MLGKTVAALVNLGHFYTALHVLTEQPPHTGVTITSSNGCNKARIFFSMLPGLAICKSRLLPLLPQLDTLSSPCLVA